jgi:hypothetical protein
MNTIFGLSGQSSLLRVRFKHAGHPRYSIDLRASWALRVLFVKSDSQSYPDTGESGEAYDVESLMSSHERVLL